MHATSYPTLAVAGGVLALAIIPFVAFTKPRSTAAAGVSA
jgi:hypothetical protein